MTVTIRLRPIARDDAPRVAVLLEQLGYPATAGEVVHRLDYWAGDAAGALIGAELNDRVVGVVALHVVPIREVTGMVGRLVTLVVDESCRRSGAGRALMRAAEERAHAVGCTMMEVTSARTRTEAHQFYRSLGYEDVCARSARMTKFLDPVHRVGR